MRKAAYSLVIALMILLASLVVFSQKTDTVRAQVDVKGESVEYTLPFAGVLPDNPLYSLKIVRDNFWLFFTRDNIKKAEVLLLFSDRKTAATQMLFEKGKWDMGIDTMREAEQNFERMVDMIVLSKNQGVSPDEALVLKMKLSNTKHRQVIEQLLIAAPQGSRKALEDIMKLNSSLSEKMNTSF